MKIELYDASTIDQLPWPKTEDGEYARKFLTPLIKEGVSPYIDNITTTYYALLVDDIVIPVTKNNRDYKNSYVCSPYTQYIDCAVESLDGFHFAKLRNAIAFLLKTFGLALKVGKINKVIAVNNWPFSTNLYPQLTQEQIVAIQKYLSQKFRKHAIYFRSVHSFNDNSLFNHLKKSKFEMIASRQVFFLDTSQQAPFEARIFKSDLRLLENTPYKLEDSQDLQEDDIHRIRELYTALYIDKHSKLNPQLKDAFIKIAAKENLLKFKYLKNENEIQGVIGYYTRNGTMTSPFFGYNIHLPKEQGMYRQLNTLLSLEAKNQGKLLHQSSGAAQYKMIRKGQGHLEYNAVFIKHLSLPRKLGWYLLKGVMNTIGATMMKKYEK